MELKGGITALFAGGPGTGKSTMLGSILEVKGVERALLLAAKPREANSFKYREHASRLTTEVFRDHAWAPVAGSFEGGSFTKLFKRVLALYEDDTFDAVILDPFTDVAHLAAHEILAPERAATPRDLRDPLGFYSALRYRIKDFTQSLTGLASMGIARPKHVLVAVHTQPSKEEDIKGKQTPEGAARGVEFQGDVLPMIEGGYRREIAGEFDIVGFTALKYENVRVGNTISREARFVVQLNADPARHAKAAVVPRLKEKEVPNSMQAIFDAIEEASK